jgi:hypothetical protein
MRTALSICQHKNLAVADVSGLGGRCDRLDGLVNEIARHCHLDLYLGQKGHGIFRVAKKFGIARLWPSCHNASFSILKAQTRPKTGHSRILPPCREPNRG